MEDELKVWCTALASWADGKTEISQLWLFGSRARGDNRSDSDLDVAVKFSPGCEGTRLADWIVLAQEWRTELADLLNVSIHLELGDSDLAPDNVGPAVVRDGIQIYERKGQETNG